MVGGTFHFVVVGMRCRTKWRVMKGVEERGEREALARGGNCRTCSSDRSSFSSTRFPCNELTFRNELVERRSAMKSSTYSTPQLLYVKIK